MKSGDGKCGECDENILSEILKDLTKYLFKKKNNKRGLEMWLSRTLVLEDNPGLIPSIHVATLNHLYIRFQRI